MAYFVPADTPIHPAEVMAPAAPAAGPWTPARHITEGVTKPTRLLGLGTGEYGKTALLEFPGGWQRTIDLPTEADAWHPLLSDLPEEDVQRLREHVAHPIVRHPDGTRTRRGALSFITQEIGRGGWWKGERCFDVPAEDCSAGSVTGYRCAAELLEALARDYGPYIPVQHVIKAALQACDEPRGSKSRLSAGFAFMEVVGHALTFMAKHSLHREFMAKKIAEAERVQAYMAELDAKEKTAFVERMKAAKAAKRSKAQHSDA
ncbi:MAG: hypothetical protein LWW96_18925 [Acidovorax sp.]|uniref:hypothetical protein n=1 Tax=Acidovorax sp. TaxID=1872122 RepID=UPI0025C1D29D|nr:hypothetical protein [Acidovorax sp.]MCE1194223.1 hypothetical protein [Acidovorax sp.]